MAFWKKLFGGASADDERADGDRLFEAEQYFDARLAYERGRDKAEGNANLREHCEKRMGECLDALANARITEAQRLASEGQLDLARAELEHAIETAASATVRETARRARERLEGEDATREAAEIDDEDDEQRWAVIAGSWDAERLDEYDEHGDELRDAILALHAGDVKGARPVLEKLAEEADDDAVYLWIEVARARLADDDEAGAEAALTLFLERVPDDEGLDARLGARVTLASIADKRGDEEAAIGAVQQAIDEMPDDPRPYLALGEYLRMKGHAKEAVSVLETALSLVDPDQANIVAWQELGLARRLARKPKGAIAMLERVIEHHLKRNIRDFPPSTAVPLAELYEEQGRLERAADLYGALARGSDRQNHLRYHRDAARVLVKLELWDEARRMLTRAAALAEKDPDTLAAVEAEIAAIDAR